MILTSIEKNIFELLLKLNIEYELGITFRVAGGWVRDKLLGVESDDIDIVIDKLTGKEFSKYLPAGKIYIIKANSAKSKHLETVSAIIDGISVDFTNLRSEIYADSTRIPSIAVGNVISDAERRDFTINSIFYNINNGEIEDYVNGINDLKNKIIRTPKPALQTFLNDPLRLLRCVRFACRFGCKIHPDIINISNNEQFLISFKNKIARERIGMEIKKIFLGPDPGLGLEYLKIFGLSNIIFENHKHDKRGRVLAKTPLNFKQEEWSHAINIINSIENLENEDKIPKYLSILLMSLDSLPNDNRELNIFLTGVITNGLKLPKKITKIVRDIILEGR